MKLFNNIVYVLSEHTHPSSPSLIRAIALATSNQADLTLLKVLPDVSPFFKSNDTSINEQELRNKIQEQEHLNLQQLADSLNIEFKIKTEQVTGKRYLEIIRLVQSNHFDLVIKEADDIDWLDHLLGRDDMHLLRKCPCPIWLMKQNEALEYKHIIAAVDLGESSKDDESDLNLTILKCASSLSLSEFTALRVVNVYDVPLAGFISQWVDQPEQTKKELYDAAYLKRQDKMTTLMDDLKISIGAESFNYVSPQSHLIQGTPDRELPKLADSLDADLVVMGTLARSGVAGLLIGNTAESVLPQLRCSVLAIKPKGFISPVS